MSQKPVWRRWPRSCPRPQRSSGNTHYLGDRLIKSQLDRRPADLPVFGQSAGSDRQIVTRSQLVPVSWVEKSAGLTSRAPAHQPSY
jgi:hypothetical protein